VALAVAFHKPDDYAIVGEYQILDSCLTPVIVDERPDSDCLTASPLLPLAGPYPSPHLDPQRPALVGPVPVSDGIPQPRTNARPHLATHDTAHGKTFHLPDGGTILPPVLGAHQPPDSSSEPGPDANPISLPLGPAHPSAHEGPNGQAQPSAHRLADKSSHTEPQFEPKRLPHGVSAQS
jgi:hypothetical protein